MKRGLRTFVIAPAPGGCPSPEYGHGFLSSGIQPPPMVMSLAGTVYSFPPLSRESFHVTF